MEKDKKKTLTISSNLTKKIDTSSISSGSKKSFSIEKKKTDLSFQTRQLNFMSTPTKNQITINKNENLRQKKVKRLKPYFWLSGGETLNIFNFGGYRIV